MQNDPLFPFRVTAGIFCLVILAAGAWMARNLDRLVPAKSYDGGENDAQRNYARFLIVAIWAHAVVLSATFAIFLL
jgi:hypothetical protein